MLSPYIVCMQSKERLVRRHTRGTRVEEVHGEVEHVAHGITLETKALRKIEENILYLLCGHVIWRSANHAG